MARSAACFASMALGLAACAPLPPTGPTVVVLPGPSKDIRTFQVEDGWCRRHSSFLVATDPGPAYVAARANQASASTIATGAAIGAVAGSLGGRVGVGALIGALYGIAAGSAIAANGAQAATVRMQAVYDQTYVQCMATYRNGPAFSAYATGY